MIKPVIWVSGAKKEFSELPHSVQGDFGHGLYMAQKGEKASFAKPLKGFGGAGVLELRDNLDGETYRAVYTVQFQGTVYVLAAFHKKAKRGIDLPQHEKELIQQRLKDARRMYEGGAG